MARKTVEIEKIREVANRMLASNISSERKVGVALLLEEALHAANRYRGYMYVDHAWVARARDTDLWATPRSEWSEEDRSKEYERRYF